MGGDSAYDLHAKGIYNIKQLKKTFVSFVDNYILLHNLRNQ